MNDLFSIWVRDYNGKKGMQEVKVSADVFNSVMGDKTIEALDSIRMNIPRKTMGSTTQEDVRYQRALGLKVKEALAKL